MKLGVRTLKKHPSGARPEHPWHAACGNGIPGEGIASRNTSTTRIQRLRVATSKDDERVRVQNGNRAQTTGIADQDGARSRSCLGFFRHGLRLFVLAALVCASPLRAAPVLEYERGLILPREQSRSSLPVSVTVSHDGDVCVTDATSSSAHVFTDKGVLVFSTGRTAHLGDPQDITVDPAGDFVCTDSRVEGGRTIRRLNFYGEPIAYEPERPTEDWAPDHILITADGNFVTTDQNGLLAKHDAGSGALLWTQASIEGESEYLGLGRPAEAPDGRLYVPLGGNRHVAVYTAAGEPESMFGTPGSNRGRFSFPVGVAFCPEGNIAVLDRMRAAVLIFDAAHKFLAEFGRLGGGERDFYYPISLAVSPNGHLYVAQGYGSRVHVFRVEDSRSIDAAKAQSWLIEAGRAGAGSAAPGWEGVPKF